MSVVGNDTRVSSRVFCFSIPPLSPFKAHISVFLPTAETCFLNRVDFPNSLSHFLYNFHVVFERL